MSTRRWCLVRTPHTPHVTADLMKLTQFHKGDSIFNTPAQQCFLLHFFFYQTAAAWPQSVWVSHKRNVAISWFCAVLQCVRAVHSTHSPHERTFQCAYHSFPATAHLGRHFSKKKTVFFCSSSVCPFSAGGERQSSWSMYFVSFIFLTQFTLRIPDYGHACVLAYQLCAPLTIFL